MCAVVDGGDCLPASQSIHITHGVDAVGTFFSARCFLFFWRIKTTCSDYYHNERPSPRHKTTV